jgi:hypothetical protein
MRSGQGVKDRKTRLAPVSEWHRGEFRPSPLGSRFGAAATARHFPLNRETLP